MEKSENIKNLAIALCKFQSEVESLELNKTVSVQTKKGGTYNFKYATLASGIDKIKPALKENGLSFSQIVESNGSVTTILLHVSGEYLIGNLHLTTSETSPQAIGSMITYAKRYSLFSILGIVAEDDDDGNGASGNNIEVKDEDNRLWLNKGSKEWNQIYKILQNGGHINKDGNWEDLNVAKVCTHYKVSKVNKEELLSISKNDM